MAKKTDKPSMMTIETLTTETITPDQVRALRAEAVAAGDEERVNLCDLALHPSHGREGDCPVCDARAACVDAINAARSMTRGAGGGA